MINTRREWLKQVGAAAALALVEPYLRGEEAPLTDAIMQLGWIWNAEYAGELVALTKGYYRAEGLNLDVRPGGPQMETMVLLIARKVPVIVADVMSSSQAVNHGAKLKIIGATFQKSPFAIVSLPDKPIRTPQDLVGKRIGVPTVQAWAMRSLCLGCKIDPQSFSIIPVSYDPAPLVNRQVDGFLSFITNEPVILAHQGIPTVAMLFADFGLSELTDTLTVREESLHDPAQRAVLKKILRGTIRGWQDAIAQPAAAAKMVVNHGGGKYALNEDVEFKSVLAEGPLIATAESRQNGLLSMSEKAIIGSMETLGRVGVAVQRSLFDPSLIEEIMGGKATI